MKKVFLLLAVVLGMAVTQASAQQKSPVRIGIKAGVNMAEWQGQTINSAQDLMDMTNGSLNRKMREGFHVGGVVSIPVLPGFEIEPGLLYSQKGMRLTGKIPMEQFDFLNAGVTVTNKAEYLDMPILAKIFIGDGFHIFAGPQFSYLLSNKVQVQAGALGFNALNREWDVNNGFRELDVAATGGIGYRFASGFNVSAGYDYGLTTVDANRNFDTFNRVIKASVGFTF
ncbi:porin family protein [Pontibacter indicus]|uniref:Outer membrane protein beta-barrel domain-containing protein n=1 Tax=Pontibacter indicus TaxID=1317125 RepID=A0A1R3X6R0_9BACT|nr:porin family protein [Pontibacter indicus]SIT85180.1 Outer membrane protein beta-barrel domain-containing protein [Pontibacter indicus]